MERGLDTKETPLFIASQGHGCDAFLFRLYFFPTTQRFYQSPPTSPTVFAEHDRKCVGIAGPNILVGQNRTDVRKSYLKTTGRPHVREHAKNNSEYVPGISRVSEWALLVDTKTKNNVSKHIPDRLPASISEDT